MSYFILAVLAINGAVLAALYCGRRRLLRLPMPGLWLLAVVLLDMLLTLGAAEVTLS